MVTFEKNFFENDRLGKPRDPYRVSAAQIFACKCGFTGMIVLDDFEIVDKFLKFISFNKIMPSDHESHPMRETLL